MEDSLNRRLISQAKSVLTAEAFVGCPLECVYCFRDAKEVVPKRLTPDEELVETLLNHKYFLRNRSPLSINCNSTDPFLPETKESTFNILTMLDSENITNIVSLITKMSLSDEDIARLKNIKSLDLEICVSYSEMPENIENADKCYRSGNIERAESLSRLSDSGLRNLLFYRPIALGWNASEENIIKVLSVARDAHVQVVMVGGLILGDAVRTRFEQLHSLKRGDDCVKALKKYLPHEIKEMLISTYAKLGLQMAMVRRTSCGRSVIRGLADYNGHWLEPETNCWKTCPKDQQIICADKKMPTCDEIGYLLDKMGKAGVKFEVNSDKSVTFYAELRRREMSFLRSNLGTMIYLKGTV